MMAPTFHKRMSNQSQSPRRFGNDMSNTIFNKTLYDTYLKHLIYKKITPESSVMFMEQ
ncbi:hypothetical protein QWZ16_13810 [Vibrio ostreicida]|uniref:Uncharacterized protein n=1 Tax=Vibrio ostreicida TaxID=526588 RepID=A0ABT8BXF1_9VIBR|nr:hypothetical protein [Vibrio ostreicida]MDN3610777.1 hypothetical protein [Vibrio ostreicida]